MDAPARSRSANALVLIVEDDPDNRDALAQYLGAVGFHVAVAENGFEALHAALRLVPDIILMDLRLRGIDGWEVTRRLGADPRTRPIPVVAVSACVFPADVNAAFEAGCVAFVGKPFDLQDLVRTVEETLETSAGGAAAMAAGAD